MTKFLAPVLVAFSLLGAVGTQAAIAAPHNPPAVSESRVGTSASYFMAPLVQQPSVVPAQLDAPRFIGPYELHDGVLPNGLTPNPPTSG